MVKILELRSGPLTIRQSPEGQPRPAGFYFGRDGFHGWDDGVTMRSDTVARPQAHGDFDSPGFLAGRLVPMSGWCLASTPRELEQYRDLFTGHGADGGKFPVVVERNGRTLRGTARLAAGTSPSFVDVGNGRRAAWSASWWFPDPRKYGEPFAFGPAASVQVTHRGNFPAQPVLQVAGAAPGGYTITGPGGRQIIVTRALAAGQPHRFDTRDGRLYVGGSRVLGGVSRADLFTLPPGLSTVTVNGGLPLTVLGETTYL